MLHLYRTKRGGVNGWFTGVYGGSHDNPIVCRINDKTIYATRESTTTPEIDDIIFAFVDKRKVTVDEEEQEVGNVTVTFDAPESITWEKVSALASSGNAAFGCDDNTGTRWESIAQDPQIWVVDYGYQKHFDRIQIIWEGAYAKTFNVYGSKNATSWDNLHSEPGLNPTGGFPYTQYIATYERDYQYIKFYGTSRGTGYGYSFWELITEDYFSTVTPDHVSFPNFDTANSTGVIDLEAPVLYSKAGEPMPATFTWSVEPEDAGTLNAEHTQFTFNEGYTHATIKARYNLNIVGELAVAKIDFATEDNLALNKTVTSMSTGATGQQNAVDGDPNTLWSALNHNTGGSEAERTYDAWFIVDLGDNYYVDAFKTSFEAARPQDFHIDLSTDGETWTTAYNYKGEALQQPLQTSAASSVTTPARYVRFFSTKAATVYGIKMYELEVYGRYAGTETYEVRRTDNAENAIKVGETFAPEFKQYVMPLNHEYNTLYTYTVAPEGIGTMNGNVFTATKEGRATITATSVEGASASVDVVVYGGPNLLLASRGTTITSYTGGYDDNEHKTGDITILNNGVEGTTKIYPAAEPTDAYFEVQATFDLQKVYRIDAFKLKFGGAAGSRDFVMEVSADGTDWTPAYEFTASTIPNNMIVTGACSKETYDVRYVRFRNIRGSEDYRFIELDEIEAYGDYIDTQAPTLTIAENPTVNTSSITLAVSAIDNYAKEIQYVVEDENGIVVATKTAAEGESTTITVSGLKQGTTYNYHVYAIDEKGNKVEKSDANKVTFTTEAGFYFVVRGKGDLTVEGKPIASGREAYYQTTAVEVGKSAVIVFDEYDKDGNAYTSPNIVYTLLPEGLGNYDAQTNTFTPSRRGVGTLEVYDMANGVSYTTYVSGYYKSGVDEKEPHLMKYKNIALKKNVIDYSCEGSQDGGRSIVHVNDGNLSSEWQSNEGVTSEEGHHEVVFDPDQQASFTIDLGNTYMIDAIGLVFEGAFSRRYRVDFSSDNTTWETVYSYTDNTEFEPGQNHEAYVAPSTTRTDVRYVRFVSLEEGGLQFNDEQDRKLSYGMKMKEIELYGDYIDTEAPQCEPYYEANYYSASLILPCTDNRSPLVYCEVTKIMCGDEEISLDGKNLKAQVENGSTAPIYVNGLKPGKDYLVTITAMDEKGNVYTITDYKISTLSMDAGIRYYNSVSGTGKTKTSFADAGTDAPVTVQYEVIYNELQTDGSSGTGSVTVWFNVLNTYGETAVDLIPSVRYSYGEDINIYCDPVQYVDGTWSVTLHKNGVRRTDFEREAYLNLYFYLPSANGGLAAVEVTDYTVGKVMDIPGTSTPYTLVAKDSWGYWATFSNLESDIFYVAKKHPAETAEEDVDLGAFDDLAEQTGVYAIGENSNHLVVTKFNLRWEKINGAAVWGYYIPKGQAVLINSSDNRGTYYVMSQPTFKPVIRPNVATRLVPGKADGTAFSPVTGHKYYKLAYGDNSTKTSLGFFWGADNGAAFKVKAGTAYLDITNGVDDAENGSNVIKYVGWGEWKDPDAPEESGNQSKASFSMFGIMKPVITDIEAIEVVNESNTPAQVAGSSVCYNLQGQRVAPNTKGIVIVNGRKYINK